MKNINLAIPDDVLYEVKSLPQKEDTIDDRLQLSLAVGMFVSKELSLAKAAQLAKKPLDEFMDILKGLSIPSITYSQDMLADDLLFADGEL